MLLMISCSSFAQIRLVLSAALTDTCFDFRKEQYIESFHILAWHGYKNPYVVEALKKNGPTFLEKYSNNVFYSTVNNPTLKNNGVNEAKTMLDGLAHFNFDPDDMIIKLTGRNHLVSEYLLRTVETHLNYDAIIRLDPHGSLYTIGFAIKYKYLKEMLEALDYNYLENNMISIEVACGQYIKRKLQEDTMKIYCLDKLDIYCTLHGSSNAPKGSQGAAVN